MCDGFAGYTNIERAENKLKQLQSVSDKYGFNLTFSLKIVDDSDISIGKLIVDKIFPTEVAA